MLPWLKISSITPLRYVYYEMNEMKRTILDLITVTYLNFNTIYLILVGWGEVEWPNLVILLVQYIWSHLDCNSWIWTAQRISMLHTLFSQKWNPPRVPLLSVRYLHSKVRCRDLDLSKVNFKSESFLYSLNRYICLHWRFDLNRLDEKFWTRFCAIWSFYIGTFLSAIYTIQPGRPFRDFFFCTRTDPSDWSVHFER